MEEDGTSVGPLSASDFVDVALTQIPSSFGKLALLADMRDESTGHYGDALAVLAYGKQLDAVLDQRQRELFFAWLGLDLAAQTTEVAQYLASDDEYQNTPIEQWIQETLYERLIPPAASKVERRLFMSDLTAILLLLRVRLHSSGESHGV